MAGFELAPQLLPLVASADWIGPYAVGTVEIGESSIYFYVPPGQTAFPNPYGCQNSNWVVFDASTLAPLANRALSVGLMVQAQEKTVKYLVTGCINTYIKATAIQIDPLW